MIYVYISPDFESYTDKDNYTFRTIIKIGYTMDETLITRDSAYRTENPGRRLLYTIPEGSSIDETNIHKRFKHLRVYGHEWFKDSEEIHEFFRKHKTKESISYLYNDRFVYNSREVGQLYRNHKYEIHKFFIAFENILGFKDQSIIQYLLEMDNIPADITNCLLDWVCEYYPDCAPSVLEEYECLIELEKKYSDIINTYRDCSNGRLSDRLRGFCDNPNISDRDKPLVSKLISEKLSQYYNHIGPTRCKALGYNITYIKQEIENKKVDPNRIREEFLKEFSVGDNIIRSKVKERISNLYQELGLDKKAKATDLGEYFEIKSSKYKCPDGNWTHSIEILSLKK